MVAVLEPCPETDLPRPAPACAGIASPPEGDACRLGQLGRLPCGDRISRVEPVEVGDVAVVDVHLAVVLEPLHEVALLADLHRREERQGIRHPGQVGIVGAEDLGGAQRVAVELTDQLCVHRRSHADVGDLGRVAREVKAILRRGGGCSDEPPLPRLADHRGEEEAGRIEECRVDRSEVGGVTGKVVVVPEVATEPCPARHRRSPGGILTGSGVVEGVGHHMRHPSLGTVEVLGGPLPALPEGGGEVDQRAMKLGEIGHLGGPVIHLDVDIEVIVCIPRQLDPFAPDPL